MYNVYFPDKLLSVLDSTTLDHNALCTFVLQSYEPTCQASSPGFSQESK